MNDHTRVMNLQALLKYSEAQSMEGPFSVDPMFSKICEGIEKFPSIQAAIDDAKENIAQTTKSDFATAWFYESVLAVATQKLGEL
jgi:hypothetical protein